MTAVPSDEILREQYGYSGKPKQWQEGFDKALQESRKRIEVAAKLIDLMWYQMQFHSSESFERIKQAREEWLKALPEPPKDKP